METRIEKRLFLLWDFEKEELWLNEMMKEGWRLVKVGFCRYEFEECEPEQYRYYIEAIEPDDEYLELVKANHVDHVGHIGQWNYYAKKTPGYFSELFNETSEKTTVEKIKDVLKIMCLVLGILFIIYTESYELLAVFFIAFAFRRKPGHRKELLEKDERVID